MLVRQIPVGSDHFAKWSESFGRNFIGCTVTTLRDFLVELCDDGVGIQVNRSIIRANAARDQFHQSGLAGTIAANECNSFPPLNVQRDIVQQWWRRVRKRQIV